MTKPKFYILVPVYKTEEYIRQCLDSILSQTYGAFQAIVVDDGTPDYAGVICDEYAEKDNRILVVHKENKGLISARRTAISYVKRHYNADEDYFLFLDSDDTLKPNALQVIADTIQRESCDLLFFGLERVRDGKFVSVHEANPFVGIIQDKRELYKRVFFSTTYNPLCRKAIKCSLMKDADYSRFYMVSGGEDLLQSIPIYGDCEKAVFISDVLYNYTVNPNSITQAVTAQNFKVDSIARSEAWKFIQAQNVLTEEDKKAYIIFCKSLLKSKIIRAAHLQTATKNIVAIFERIKADLYYSMLLNDGVNDAVLSRFQKGRYKAIIVRARASRFVSKTYHFLRGEKK